MMCVNLSVWIWCHILVSESQYLCHTHVDFSAIMHTDIMFIIKAGIDTDFLKLWRIKWKKIPSYIGVTNNSFQFSDSNESISFKVFDDRYSLQNLSFLFLMNTFFKSFYKMKVFIYKYICIYLGFIYFIFFSIFRNWRYIEDFDRILIVKNCHSYNHFIVI